MDIQKIDQMIDLISEITALKTYQKQAILTRIKQTGKRLEQVTIAELIEYLKPHLTK